MPEVQQIDLSIRRVARVTLEFTTPFLVGSGRGDAFTDHLPVQDVNDLPALPGSSLAGVLRHGFEADAARRARADGLFGSSEGHGSRLWVTWGHIHDAGDRPVEGMHLQPPSDEVLDSARALVIRDHVRIGHRGAVDGDGKFDQAVVPAGHRFTFDLTLEGGPDEEHDDDDFRWLLRYLASSRSRLGGSVRRGLGAFKVVRCLTRTFDLRRREDAEAFSLLPVRLDEPATALKREDPTPLREAETWRTLTLRLSAEDYWGFNGADAWTFDGEKKAPDFNPVRDRRVVWKNGRGALSAPRMYAPGSALKGPIAHRVAFHHSRGAEAWQRVDLTGESNPAVRALFGSVHDRDERGNGDDDKEKDKARAGKVYVDDVWLDEGQQTQRLMHNSQDRFAGGVRAGILFEERCLYGGGFELTLQVEDYEKIDADARVALRESLRDLAEGRLQLGAGAGRGHGYFRLADGDFDALWDTFEKGGAR